MLSKMESRVIQTNDNGVFGGTFCNDFEYTYSGVSYRVRIEQQLKREWIIATDSVVECIELFNMFAFLDQLLFIFDGRFYPVEIAEIIDENENPLMYKHQVDHYFNYRLPVYNSRDICKHTWMKLINFSDIEFESVLTDWSLINEELDIAYPMFMYCLSDIPMPVDCKIANLIEIAKPLGEIVEKKNKKFSMPRSENNKLTLKNALKALIDEFGQEIFKVEINSKYYDLLTSFVNTRNKISHVKSQRNKNCLDGKQCVFYTAKLSIMYRVILYSILNIDINIYNYKLKEAISKWDAWYYNN